MDWQALKSLRAEFLAETAVKGPAYWSDAALLQAYDESFAQRIRWKWDAVLAELLEKHWAPKSTSVVDWGCGSGIATEAFFSAFPKTQTAHLFDRSALAMDYSQRKLEKLGLKASLCTSPPEAPYTLLLSHVLNELKDAGLKSLLPWIDQAESVLWVEPGMSETSRHLISLREELKTRFHIVAPCPHTGSCGLLDAKNARHWCHFFAPAPQEVFHSAFWSQFSKELQIDLRSLPVSYLVLDKDAKVTIGQRVIGKGRHYKGYSLALVCEASGVSERRLLTRNEKDKIKALKDEPFSLTWD